MTQPSLFQSDAEPMTHPGEPGIWIQRLVILPSREVDTVHLRNIEFRLGLNVINTKPTSDPESTAFGHNVGKSLLVRMIRFALGDDSYAENRTRACIQTQHAGACVLAQVRLKGEPWVVIRTLAKPRDSHCVRSETWQDALKPKEELEPYANFESATAQLLPKEFPGLRVGRGRRAPGWRDLLGWLVRDQRCRYTSHNAWRTEEPDYGTDSILDSEANLIIRVIMRVFDRKEHDLSGELDDLRTKLRQTQTELGEIRQERERTARLFAKEGNVSEDLSEGELAQHGIRARIQVQSEAAEAALSALPELTAQTEAEQVLVARRAARDSTEGRRGQIDRDLQLTRDRLELAKKPDDVEALNRNRKKLTCGLTECEWLKPGAAMPADPNKAERIAELESDLARVQSEFAAAGAEYDQLEAGVRDADQTYRDAKARHETAAKGLRQQVARCEWLIRQLDQFLRDTTRQAELDASRQSLDAKIREAEAQREARANSRKKQLSRLNEVYEAVTNGLIRRPAGRLSLDLRSGLAPNAEAASGEAYGSVGQVVGFDMTCMCAAIQGEADHPRFLLHDSPREADLHEAIYHNLFRFVLTLEQKFPQNLPPFQYILTTTSPPPGAVQTEHIRETLDDESPDGRLMRFAF